MTPTSTQDYPSTRTARVDPYLYLAELRQAQLRQRAAERRLIHQASQTQQGQGWGIRFAARLVALRGLRGAPGVTIAPAPSRAE